MGWGAVGADPDLPRHLPLDAAYPTVTYLTCPICYPLDRHTEMWWATAEGVAEMGSCQDDRYPDEGGKIRPDSAEVLRLMEPEAPRVGRRHRTPVSPPVHLLEQPKPG